VVSKTASLQFSHKFTPKLSVSAAGGPQWTSFGAPFGTSSISLFADVAANYTGQFSHAAFTYVRSTNTGFGVVGGALSSGVTFTAGRTFARVWNCAVTAAYTQTANLPSPAIAAFSFHTTVAGIQLSRAIVRSLSGFANYTLQNQSSAGASNAVDVFSGLSQLASFGLTFSPNSLHFGRQ
jgi:hypothetical protein